MIPSFKLMGRRKFWEVGTYECVKVYGHYTCGGGKGGENEGEKGT